MMNKTITVLCVVVSVFALLICVAGCFNEKQDETTVTVGQTGGDCDDISALSDVQTTHGFNKDPAAVYTIAAPETAASTTVAGEKTTAHAVPEITSEATTVASAKTTVASADTTASVTDETTNTTVGADNTFPEIVKVVLYIDGVPSEISTDDSRLAKMTDYIMKAYNEHNYLDNSGELRQSVIDDYYKSKAKAYMELELESDADNVFHRYNRAVIAYADVIMIDDSTFSYHGEGNPFNFKFSPYNTGGVPVAPILYMCGFTNSSLPYRDN